ncbi:ATP-binding protein [Cyclobacterium jeungdonense]|uniref:ATP-binding protein n=1 Tax=Cyclobacterium jeungdonense TaxID=708087 RepID=A0ABT8CAE7_9BACT|nr:ATP-binding protein [Cyclobacterium jeungdonense]MDN3689107.1 ATP-binding protein [Cyclobacterium jeungdonense]
MLPLDLLKEVALSQRSDLNTRTQGLERKELDNFPVLKSHSLIISGIRRCGKSTLLVQLMKKTYPTAFYLNFEDPRLYGFTVEDFQKIDKLVKEQKHNELLFDETQVVAGWERYIRQKLDQGNHQIIITGSNASLLSKELGTKLTGRHITKELFPFSFGQFCAIKELPKSPESTSDYLQKGGFPEYIKSEKIELLHQLFDDLLLRDITVRYGVRDFRSLQHLAMYLVSNVSKLVSGNNLRKTLEIKATSTVMEYFSYLEESWLFFFIPKFSYSKKKQLINPKKVYAIDTGLVSANSRSFSDDQGRKFENMVFLHFRRKYQEIYYFSDKQECDFVLCDRSGPVSLVQVCVKLNPDNLNRELDGLWEAMKFFDKKESLLVTLSQEDEFYDAGRKVVVVPFHKLKD